MTRGHVYIMTNPSMPGLVKIGMTERGIAQRAHELWTTGVPTPFQVHAHYLAPDCRWLENEVHGRLADRRVHASREFFCMAASDAAEAVEACLHAYLEQYVGSFLPGASIISGEIYPAVERIKDMCAEHNVSADVLARALAKVDAAALVEAIEDAAEQDAKAKEELAMFGPEDATKIADDWW